MVPISSLPTFRPALMQPRVPIPGLAFFTSSMAEATAMLASIMAPDAPRIIPATSRPLRFHPTVSLDSHSRFPTLRNPKVMSSPVNRRT